MTSDSTRVNGQGAGDEVGVVDTASMLSMIRHFFLLHRVGVDLDDKEYMAGIVGDGSTSSTNLGPCVTMGLPCV